MKRKKGNNLNIIIYLSLTNKYFISSLVQTIFMKRIIFIVLMLTPFISKAQFVSIPDTNFRNAIMSTYPSCFNINKEMDTTCNDIVNAINITLVPSYITSIEGVQYFDNLLYLDCSLNLLTSLPSLPGTVTEINCGNNQITSLPNLPPNLIELYCYNNSLTSLPNLPSSLKELNCQANMLTSLPNLPNNLEYLSSGENSIILFPTLPNSLKSFDCGSTQLTILPGLPNSLTELYCDYNFLTSLPILPSSLRALYCHNNLLSILPTLPDTLIVLYCGNNFLTALPSFPDSLVYFYGDGNLLLSCLPLLPQSLMYCTFIFTDIQCVPNIVAGLNLGIPLCPNGSSCEPSPSISGTVFHDINNNGNFDFGVDSALDNKLVNNSIGWHATSCHNGNYQIKLDSGIINNINCIPGNSNYFNINPQLYNIAPVSGGSQGTNYNFAVQPLPNINDLRVDIAKGPARPGFNQWINTTINNDGTENATNVTLKLLKPSLLIS